MKTTFVLLSLCVWLSLTQSLLNDHVVPKNREIVVKDKLQPENKNFLGLLLVPCMLLDFWCTNHGNCWLKNLFTWRYNLLLRCYWYMAAFPTVHAAQCQRNGTKSFLAERRPNPKLLQRKIIVQCTALTQTKHVHVFVKLPQLLNFYFQYFSRESSSQLSKTKHSFR